MWGRLLKSVMMWSVVFSLGVILPSLVQGQLGLSACIYTLILRYSTQSSVVSHDWLTRLNLPALHVCGGVSANEGSSN